jgi:hypothetical protein
MPRSRSAARPSLDRVRSLVVVIALVVIGALVWRWQLQTVDVVIVNASGTEAQFSWQPQLFAQLATNAVGGCEAKSITLRAGETWRLEGDKLDIDSTAVNVPFFEPAVAAEVWLNADGSHRFVPAYPIHAAVSLPIPPGCSNGSN